MPAVARGAGGEKGYMRIAMGNGKPAQGLCCTNCQSSYPIVPATP